MLLLFRDSHFQLTDSLRPYNLDQEHDVAGVIDSSPKMKQSNWKSDSIGNKSSTSSAEA